MYDILIIGGGIAGLAIAALIAKRTSWKTLLIEKNNYVGGRVAVTEKSGFKLDYGIHAVLFSKKSSINYALRKCGKRVDFFDAGMCFYDKGKFKTFFESDLLTSLKGLKLVDAEDIFKIASLFFDYLINPDKVYAKSIETWFREIDASDNLKKIFKTFSIGLLATTSYDRASAGEIVDFMKQVMMRGKAVGYPSGGWASIIKSFQNCIEESKNAELLLKTKVDSVIVENGIVRGVKIHKGKFIPARTVVCAFPAQYLIRDNILERSLLPEWYIKKIENIRITTGVSIDIALEKKISAEKRVIITIEPPSLGWFVSNIASDVAPPKKQILTLFSPIDEEKFTDNNHIEEVMKRLEDTYNKIFPEIKQNTMWKRKLKVIVNGAELNTKQTIFNRASIKAPKIEGLFLIGDTAAVRGAGGEMAAKSALECFKILMTCGHFFQSYENSHLNLLNKDN